MRKEIHCQETVSSHKNHKFHLKVQWEDQTIVEYPCQGQTIVIVKRDQLVEIEWINNRFKIRNKLLVITKLITSEIVWVIKSTL